MNDGKKKPDKAMQSAQRSSKASKGKLGREIQNRIGHQLRTMYADVVNEGVPDRFADLLKQLDGDKEQKK